MKLLVSACLLGVACKYSGGHNACPALLDALRRGGHTIVPVCPEVYGGLPTPRPPAERTGDRVMTQAGADVTEPYPPGRGNCAGSGPADGVRGCGPQGQQPQLRAGRHL